MCLIRKSRFDKRGKVCRICGARKNGNPKIERTICRCPEEGFMFFDDARRQEYYQREAAKAGGKDE